ncbi:MAG: hypothetical protein IKO56_01065 [Alphaproteobacteria bacterium]|nr:hypothetical protein [Bacteroidales bacterium]MBR4624109.1 hypothetical protein [Alphaproteobacteria bacterium]
MNQIELETYNNPTTFAERESKTYLGNVDRLYQRLLQVSKLQQGWDGYNALPVNSQVIDNMHVVLDNCDSTQLQGWQIFPEINGTILLQNSVRRAGINLGDKTFSYFIINGNNVDGDDSKAFSVSLFLNVLNELND